MKVRNLGPRFTVSILGAFALAAALPLHGLAQGNHQGSEAPNRFGLPAFSTLHVWAWKDNPTGMFVNWHSGVSCEAFSGE